MSEDRLQKVLAQAGFGSRRACESLIAAGRVRVNGKTVTELGTKVGRGDRVDLDGSRVVAEQQVYFVFHKPRGVVATMADPEGRPSVRDYLKSIRARVFPVGRLDFATSGVLLVTNDGEFSEGLLHPKRAVPKTYVVKVAGRMEERDLERWAKGVILEDGKTLPAEATLIRYEGDKTWFEVTIREGRNQQIRRMGEATGFRVMRLARLSFANIPSEGLKPGAFRAITREELLQLRKEHGVPRRIPASAPLDSIQSRARAQKGDRVVAPEQVQRDARRGGGPRERVRANDRRTAVPSGPRENARDRAPERKPERPHGRGVPRRDPSHEEHHKAPQRDPVRRERTGGPPRDPAREGRRGPPKQEPPRGDRRSPPREPAAEKRRGPPREPTRRDNRSRGPVKPAGSRRR
jgi:23S rRNA pseudouridine2605 synthase